MMNEVILVFLAIGIATSDLIFNLSDASEMSMYVCVKS